VGRRLAYGRLGSGIPGIRRSSDYWRRWPSGFRRTARDPSCPFRQDHSSLFPAAAFLGRSASRSSFVWPKPPPLLQTNPDLGVAGGDNPGSLVRAAEDALRLLPAWHSVAAVRSSSDSFLRLLRERERAIVFTTLRQHPPIRLRLPPASSSISCFGFGANSIVPAIRTRRLRQLGQPPGACRSRARRGPRIARGARQRVADGATSESSSSLDRAGRIGRSGSARAPDGRAPSRHDFRPPVAIRSSNCSNLGNPGAADLAQPVSDILRCRTRAHSSMHSPIISL